MQLSSNSGALIGKERKYAPHIAPARTHRSFPPDSAFTSLNLFCVCALQVKEFQGLVGPPSLGGMVGQKHMEHLRGDRRAALCRLPALGSEGEKISVAWSGLEIQGEEGSLVPIKRTTLEKKVMLIIEGGIRNVLDKLLVSGISQPPFL